MLKTVEKFEWLRRSKFGGLKAQRLTGLKPFGAFSLLFF